LWLKNSSFSESEIPNIFFNLFYFANLQST
jgi:hypothetical protein